MSEGLYRSFAEATGSTNVNRDIASRVLEEVSLILENNHVFIPLFLSIYDKTGEKSKKATLFCYAEVSEQGLALLYRQSRLLQGTLMTNHIPYFLVFWNHIFGRKYGHRTLMIILTIVINNKLLLYYYSPV